MQEQAPWEALWHKVQDLLPAPVAALPGWVQIAVALAVVGVGAIILLALLFIMLRLVFGRRRGKPKPPNLEEDLASYPPLQRSTGDRRLTVEGVPVRLRLVVLGPAGKQSEIDEENIEATLEKMLPGLGAVFENDRPRLRIWPMQLSYQGFTKHFHRNTLVPEAAGELSQWVVVAGRAKVGKDQMMVGLAMQALKPTTVGRLTIEAHEWAAKLRVRVRD